MVTNERERLWETVETSEILSEFRARAKTRFVSTVARRRRGRVEARREALRL